VGSDVKYQEAMREVLRQLVDRAADKNGSTSPFEQGVQMGYFEAVNAILGELETFGIDPADVGMAGFNPLSMLGSHQQAA
jgi:hypothetical protein